MILGERDARSENLVRTTEGKVPTVAIGLANDTHCRKNRAVIRSDSDSQPGRFCAKIIVRYWSNLANESCDNQLSIRHIRSLARGHLAQAALNHEI